MIRSSGARREVKLARIARGRYTYLHEDGPSTLKSVLLAARTTARTCNSTWNPIHRSQAEPGGWLGRGDGWGEGRENMPGLRTEWIDAWPHVWSGSVFGDRIYSNMDRMIMEEGEEGHLRLIRRFFFYRKNSRRSQINFNQSTSAADVKWKIRTECKFVKRNVIRPWEKERRLKTEDVDCLLFILSPIYEICCNY